MTRPRRVKKCSERFTDSCDPTETDGCCSIIPCGYCLLLERYGEDDLIGEATFDGSQWYGTVGGNVFQSYWESAYGQCEFVVLFNAEEVSRDPCYGAVSCKDASGSAGVTIGYDDWTLTWTKQENRPLPHVTEDGCVKHWCGSCNCVCPELRVELSGAGMSGREKLTEYAQDDCDGPVWTGTVDGHAIVVRLEADQYTNECLLTGSIDGDEFDAVAITDCAAIDETIALYGGGAISISCAVCGDIGPVIIEPCDASYTGSLFVSGDISGTIAYDVGSQHWDTPFPGITPPAWPCSVEIFVKCIDGALTVTVGDYIAAPNTSSWSVDIVSQDPILINVARTASPVGCSLIEFTISE